MSNDLVPYSDMEKMSVVIAQSKLFGMKTPQEALALMLIAQSENLHPARAAMEYHIVQGRPTLKADAMLSRFQNAGGKVEWKSYTDEECIGVFSHPQGGAVTITWSIAMATKAGLTKNPTWRTYPRAMLRARCISEGIRTVYPGVSVGIYTPEEVSDFVPEKDVTPEKPEPQAKPVSMPEKVKAAAAALKGKAAPKPDKPDALEGQYTTITGDPSEGDLSDVATEAPPPADEETVRKLVKAFFDIGVDMDALEALLGKSVDDLTTKDVLDAKLIYKQRKAAQPQEEI